MSDEKSPNEKEEKEHKKSIKQLISSSLPPWITSALNNPRAWKNLARCWLASWATFLLLLPETSLKALGNAAFFGVIASLLLPPSMPLQMFIFAIMTLLVGMCMGWAWGAAAMRAALTARSQILLASEFQRAQQGAAGAVNPDAVFQLDVFQGMFIDWRAVIVYGVFLGTGVAFFAFVRAYAPRLSLLAIFGTIVLDIFCSFGPLIPAASYKIVSSFLISTSCYTAIALASIILIFPETLQHAYLDSVETLLKSMATFIEFQDKVLALKNSDKESIADLEKQSMGKRIGILLSLQGLTSRTALVDAEFSFGRWSGHDCASLEDPLKVLTGSIASMHSFTSALSRGLSELFSAPNATTSSPATQTSDMSGGDDLTRQLFLASSLPPSGSSAQHKQQYAKPLLHTLPILSSSTSSLRNACASTLIACAEYVGAVNHGRWASGSTHRNNVEEKEKVLDERMKILRTELEEYRREGRMEIVEPFVPVLQKYLHGHKFGNSVAPSALDVSELDESGLTKMTDGHKSGSSRTTLPLRPLIIACVFASQICTTSDSVLSLASSLQTLGSKRPRRRLWAPGGLRKVAKFALGRGKVKAAGEDARPDEIIDDDDSTLAGDEGESAKEGKDKDGMKSYRRDPDSRPPANAFQKMMDLNHRLWKWSHTAEAIFVWKNVIISLVLWFPGTLSSFAHFYYVEKGVWALIMAQTTMNIYMSDQLYNYAARLFGTFVGLVIGLVAWYAGNGHGNGNPYGSAAATAVVLVPILFARINAPLTSLVPVMMCSATFVLIVGYSWIDGHLQTIGNPGIGWSIAWKRWVLVVIGCGASFILMMIPPTSARKAVRIKNATVIGELSSLYALLMSAWIMEEEDDSQDNKSKVKSKSRPVSVNGDVEKGQSTDDPSPTLASSKWGNEFRSRFIPLATQLQALRTQTTVAKWEGNLRGVWPFEEYNALLDKEYEMLSSLAQLSSALRHLDPEWRMSLTKGTLVLNPNFITDVMSIFALVSQSLRTGEPLHQILPSSLLDRMLYHQSHKELVLSASSDAAGAGSTGEDAVGGSETDAGAGEKIDPVERIQSPEFIYYATGIAAVAHIITCLDEMHRITKRLCGEVPFRGFEEWRQEYERVYNLH